MLDLVWQVSYAKVLEMSTSFKWHIFLEVGKTQDFPSKILQTHGDALREAVMHDLIHK
jgi:hypothetical protein